MCVRVCVGGGPCGERVAWRLHALVSAQIRTPAINVGIMQTRVGLPSIFAAVSNAQAGSDSLLTSTTFMKLAQQRFQGIEGVEQHRGILYGLGEDGRTNMLSAED